MIKQQSHIKRSSTLLLRGAIFLIGLAVLAICIFILPPFIGAELTGDFDYGFILLGLYVTTVPFFFGLYQALQLLRYIDSGKAFSSVSVTALKRIKYCAFGIAGVYTASLPYVFHLADMDDAPGMFAVWLVVTFAAFVITVSVAILQRLLQDAVDIQSENELTV
jgi:hypothetical protein